MLYTLKFKGQIRLLLNHGCILSSPTWIPDLSSHISIFDVLCGCALTGPCSFATFRKAGECCTFFPILSKIQMASFWFAMPRMSSVLFRAHLALCSRLNKGFKIFCTTLLQLTENEWIVPWMPELPPGQSSSTLDWQVELSAVGLFSQGAPQHHLSLRGAPVLTVPQPWKQTVLLQCQ